MSDLPVCKLCNSTPFPIDALGTVVHPKNWCPLSHKEMWPEQWNILMGHPTTQVEAKLCSACHGECGRTVEEFHGDRIIEVHWVDCDRCGGNGSEPDTQFVQQKKYFDPIIPEYAVKVGERTLDLMLEIPNISVRTMALAVYTDMNLVIHNQEQPDNQLRFASACELDGPKHPEYVKGWEAAMDAVCKLMDGAKPRAWEDDEGCLHTTLESATFSSKHATPLYAGIPPVQESTTNHDLLSVAREMLDARGRVVEPETVVRWRKVLERVPGQTAILRKPEEPGGE